MAVAGRVLMIPAGTWTSGKNYAMLDVVIYAGSSYVAKKQINNSTVVPPNATSDWQLLSQGFDVTNVVTKDMIVNNFLATDPNTVLSGPMGKSLKDQFDTLNSDLQNQIATTNSKLITVSDNINGIIPIPLTTLGVFLGTINRNASGISGDQVNISLTITAPVSGIANETTFFYINRKLKPVVAPVLLSTYKAGYIYSYVNGIGDTVFAARVDGGISGSAEIYINFNCLLDD